MYTYKCTSVPVQVDNTGTAMLQLFFTPGTSCGISGTVLLVLVFCKVPSGQFPATASPPKNTLPPLYEKRERRRKNRCSQAVLHTLCFRIRFCFPESAGAIYIFALHCFAHFCALRIGYLPSLEFAGGGGTCLRSPLLPSTLQ